MQSLLLKIRAFLITLFHVFVIAASVLLAFWVRFDFSASSLHSDLAWVGLSLAVAVKLPAFLLGGVQRGWWRYAGLNDLSRIFLVNVAASVGWAIVVVTLHGPDFPRSIYVIDFLVCFLLSAGGRFSVRLYNETLKFELAAAKKENKNILIYGAGAAGRTLVREIRMNLSLGLQVVGFIDDNPLLRSASIMNVRVLGTGRDIARIVERYQNRGSNIDEVIIAMPSATGLQMREAHASCRAAGIACRTIPGFSDLLSGKYLSAQIRSISIEDLLGREQIRLEETRIQESIAAKSIMVTGAAGSIGSELCRQAASFVPGRLVLFDQAESELFKMDQELRQKYPGIDIIAVVGDIRDYRTVDDVVRTHSIESIYHAAAYKHVPMMEAHVIEAVRNNVVGTWNVVRVAQRHRVANFLMISSDKAVNPTSVMGVTKRIAELIVAAASKGEDNSTKFVSVRFGNVLGSNGSVVPTFQSQIAAGGPVTVTHPDMRRYFMSIREAVLLVLQASTMGKGSEIFVLEMGEPVRVLDLAYNMIQLAGLTPDEDIEVRITGLRPGEKLFEEIALDGENMMPTYHEKIRIFRGTVVEPDFLSAWMDQLQLLVSRRDTDRILVHLATLVPEYSPQRALKEIIATNPSKAVATAGKALNT
jgi:FlaA1/EpsC-like NDP-sugar epimerase